MIIISTCSKSHIAELHLWQAKLFRAGVPSDIVTIYCCDLESMHYCHRNGIKAVHLSLDNSSHASLMKARLKLFIDLSYQGQTFIHSDLDAFWEQDICQYLQKIKSDLVFSCGTVHPISAYYKFGFSLCNGFLFSRASRKTKIFWEKCLEYSIASNSQGDQAPVNEVIVESFHSWINQSERVTFPSYTMPMGVVKILSCSYPVDMLQFNCQIIMPKTEIKESFVQLCFSRLQSLVRRSHFLITVSVIPHSDVSRACHLEIGKFVNHPLCPYSPERISYYDKLGILKNLGADILRESFLLSKEYSP
jgi:hypothetical protein